MAVRFVYASVATNDPMIGIRRVNPNGMIVHVLVRFACGFKGHAGIFGVMHVGIHGKHFAFVQGVTKNFLVVISASGKPALFAPCFAVIGA